MQGLFQPAHLFFILIIVLILFGPGKLPEIGQRLRRFHSDLRGVPSSFRNAVFMAKGVDSSIGRDVGDVLPEQHLSRHETWFLYLLAILIGNTVYFLLSPVLPEAARMNSGLSSGLPALVDLWTCFLVFGLLNLVKVLEKHGPGSREI